MLVLHIRRPWRREEIGCAKSYSETILRLETKLDLSHVTLCLVCIVCAEVERGAQ